MLKLTLLSINVYSWLFSYDDFLEVQVLWQRAWTFLRLLFWHILPSSPPERFNILALTSETHKGLYIPCYAQFLKTTNCPSANMILHVSFLRSTTEDTPNKRIDSRESSHFPLSSSSSTQAWGAGLGRLCFPSSACWQLMSAAWPLQGGKYLGATNTIPFGLSPEIPQLSDQRQGPRVSEWKGTSLLLTLAWPAGQYQFLWMTAGSLSHISTALSQDDTCRLAWNDTGEKMLLLCGLDLTPL